MLATPANDRWIAQVAIAMLSAATSARQPPPCLLIDCGITAEHRAVLDSAFAAQSVELHWFEADLDALRALPVDAPHLGPETYARLDVPTHLRDRARRTVYLDADTLTVGDIDYLATCDLGGQTLAAVQDARVRLVSAPNGVTGWERLGLSRETPYFNAGVLVIDNDHWVERECRQMVLDMIRDHPEEVVFADQGPLNAVFAREWVPLDSRWNAVMGPAISVRGSLSLRAQLRAGSDGQPGIIHFAGPVKPWHPNYAPSTQRSLYLKAWRRFAPFAKPPTHLPAWRWVLDRELYERKLDQTV